jgi:hypothetical protein
MNLNSTMLLKKKLRGSKMYKIFLTIAIIAIFCFKQSHDTKKYKVETNNQLEFNNNKLHAVIADVWNINN